MLRRLARWAGGAAACVWALVAYAWLSLPDVRSLTVDNPARTAWTDLRAAEARAEGRAPKQVQRWVPYRRISPNVTRAVLVAEDAAFYSHDGVDYDELEKSIELDLAKGQMLRGASTITQQLAKNLYLSPSRNPLRKLKELIIARRLEAALTKRRILEIYLNVIEWGDGIYGIEAAAQTYFHQSAASLDPTQAALLAGAIVNPRVLTPARPTPRLRRRQAIILKRMGGVRPPAAEATPAGEVAPPAAPTVADDEAIPSRNTGPAHQP